MVKENLQPMPHQLIVYDGTITIFINIGAKFRVGNYLDVW